MLHGHRGAGRRAVGAGVERAGDRDHAVAERAGAGQSADRAAFAQGVEGRALGDGEIVGAAETRAEQAGVHTDGAAECVAGAGEAERVRAELEQTAVCRAGERRIGEEILRDRVGGERGVDHRAVGGHLDGGQVLEGLPGRVWPERAAVP